MSRKAKAVIQKSHKSRRKYWVTPSSAYTAHSFAGSTTLCFIHMLRCTHSFAHWLTHSKARGKVITSSCSEPCSVGQINQNPDESTGPLTFRLLVCSHRPLVRSLAHSLTRGKMNNWMAIFSVFFMFWTTVPRWHDVVSFHINMETFGHFVDCFGVDFPAKTG